MSPTSEFRSILAWQRAMELAEMVWSMTAPPSVAGVTTVFARTDLRRRSRRAAIAIPALIATAATLDDRAQRRRDLARARRRLAALATWLELVMRLHMAPRDPRIVDLLREVDHLIRELPSQ